MIQRGFVNSAELPILKIVVQDTKPAWTRWILTELIQKKKSVSMKSTRNGELLKYACQRNNYSLAAFLLTLGANPAHMPFDPKTSDGIKKSAEAMAKGSPAEQELRALILPKNIAHLVGDSIVENMKDDSDNPLEGNIASESLAFLSSSLNMVAEDHKGPGRNELRKLQRRLERSQDLALRMEEIQRLTDIHDTGSSIDHLEKNLLDEIEAMPQGEAVLIPAGWITNNVAHAIAVECKVIAPGRMQVNVINTGEGLEHHGGVADLARLHINTVRRYEMSLEDFRKDHLIRRMIEPSIASSAEREYYPMDIYGFLEKYLVSEKKTPTDIVPREEVRKGQLAGTCSMRCYLAYCKLNLPPKEYKAVKSILTEKTVEFALDQNELLLNKLPALAKLLSLATPNLFHNLVKRLSRPGVDLALEEKRLAKLRQISTKLNNIVADAVSEHSAIPEVAALPKTTIFDTRTKETSKLVRELVKEHLVKSQKAYSGTFEPGIFLPISTTDITTISSIAELEKYLSSLARNCSRYGNVDRRLTERYLATSLISFGKGISPRRCKRTPP